MKKVLTLLFFTLVVNFSYAECGMNGMEFFPEKEREIFFRQPQP
jgi:predicted small lipoprotein YifL